MRQFNMNTPTEEILESLEFARRSILDLKNIWNSEGVLVDEKISALKNWLTVNLQANDKVTHSHQRTLLDALINLQSFLDCMFEEAMRELEKLQDHMSEIQEPLKH